MVVREGQLSPMHFHWEKREDLIKIRGKGQQIEISSFDGLEVIVNKRLLEFAQPLLLNMRLFPVAVAVVAAD